MSERLDAAVIGGGAVGLAVAARLARPETTIAVFERHRRHGLETSSRSSEVIHAGFYYPPESLKARLCVGGRRKLYALAAEGAFAVRKVGKMVVAQDDAEAQKLADLLARGAESGVEGLSLLDAASVQQKAPGVRARAALWSAETGVMDTEGLMQTYLGQARDQGAMVVFDAALERVERLPNGYRLFFSGGVDPVETRVVVNAAGLAADRVAAMAGLDPDALGCRLHWFKGEYFALKRALPPSCLIYPVPGLHGLGIHLTVDLRGRQRLGPSAFAVERLDYAVDAAHADSFFEAARRYWPDLKAADLIPGTAGIRPKLSADGAFRDFVIAERTGQGLPGWVDLIGIESPGLTASPAIAELVGDMLEWRP